jgi:hypothetical protein
VATVKEKSKERAKMKESNIRENYLQEKVHKYEKIKTSIEAMKARHEEELKPLLELQQGLADQIKGFLLRIGTRFMKTKYGDPGIYTKLSFRVEDQDAFKTHVITHKAWDLLIWGVRRTAAESYSVVHNQYPPGVVVTKTSELRVTAPTPTGTRRKSKTAEVEEDKFNAFE